MTTTNRPTRGFSRAEYIRRKWEQLTDDQRQRLADNGARLARWQRLTGLNYRNWSNWVNR